MESIETIVDNSASYNRNFPKELKGYHQKKRKICEMMNVLARWEESFHNIYVYQIITVYTLNYLKILSVFSV